MVKILKLANFIDSNRGKTLDEIAGHFSVSKRTAQRWLLQLQAAFPGLQVEEFWDSTGAKRFRCSKKHDTEATITGRTNVLDFWSLTLASEVLHARGLHDDADAILAVKEKMLANAPRAVRQQIDAQIERLAQAEGVALRKINASVPKGIATKLRLAALHGRGAIVTLKSGKQINGDVFKIVLEPIPTVQLRDGTRLARIAIEDIIDVSGSNDLYWAQAFKAA